MIKLKDLLKEDASQDIVNKLSGLYKTYHDLLNQMYGPDGTETRKAAALVKHLGTQGSFDPNRKATSPEMDKADTENKELMKQMGQLGTQMQSLYTKLEDLGKGDLVKKMREFQRKETENYILKVSDQAIVKSQSDAEAERAELKKAIDKKYKDYQDAYKKWLYSPKTTPPPIPPTITPTMK